MIKLENYEVLGWEHAIRGMRNPMNSWEKSDSRYLVPRGGVPAPTIFQFGPNDIDLMMRLRNAGTDHRKFMRMITVYVDILAPLYWWKEFDTYKVGTVANSCSTMHKIHEKEFTLEDFSYEHLGESVIVDGHDLNISTSCLKQTIKVLNTARAWYIELSQIDEKSWEMAPKAKGLTDKSLAEAKKSLWWQLIQLLPSSYNQKRTVMLNYEVLANIYKSRKTHKLDEWRDFCSWIENLPYSEIITGYLED